MATLTITTSGAVDARVAPAVGDYIGIAGNANAAQVKQLVADFLTNIVLQYERKNARVTAEAAVTPITVS